MLVSVITWIIFGGLAGWIAALIKENRSRKMIAKCIAIGITGAILGGLFASQIMKFAMNDFYLSSVLLALPTAVLILGIHEYTSK